MDVSAPRSGAATLGALRAYADRTAVTRRHHDPAINRRLAPREPEAADLFQALERGRLDALGVRWMRGVAQNILGYPGKDADGLRWLAFELCSGVTCATREDRARGADARRSCPLPCWRR